MSENEKNEQNEYAPLKGIKVIDWTQVQSGPSCTQLLAWLGADVIKVERTNTGDPTRNELLDIQDSWSLYYLQLNANKKSLTLNIKTDEGKKIMYDLIKKADVFVENIAPGSAERNGFGWEKLHAMNPKLIYASLKGFNKGSRFENVKAFGGDSYRVNNYTEMKDALEKAYESGNPTIIDAQIPASMGKESGHIGNLNPKLDLSSLEEKENK